MVKMLLVGMFMVGMYMVKMLGMLKMLFVGIQYLVEKVCCMLKGVGVATMTVVFYLDIYYCVIIAWTFFYLIATFTSIPDLPWNTCDGWWNTEFCFKAHDNVTENQVIEMVN